MDGNTSTVPLQKSISVALPKQPIRSLTKKSVCRQNIGEIGKEAKDIKYL